MTINYKKSAKLITLIVSAIFIATASAATYRYMYIDGSVTVGTSKLIWIEGIDSPGDATVSGSTYTTDLNVEPGTPLNFTECVFLKNQDSAAHNMTISVTTTISASDFAEAKMHIYSNSTGPWVYVDTLDMTTSDSYGTYAGNTPLGAGNYYRMTFEIAATLTASGVYNFDLQVQYE